MNREVEGVGCNRTVGGAKAACLGGTALGLLLSSVLLAVLAGVSALPVSATVAGAAAAAAALGAALLWWRPWRRRAAARAHAEWVIRHATDGILTIDREGVVRSFNPAAEQLFGYNAEEVIGGSAGRLFAARPAGDVTRPPPAGIPFGTVLGLAAGARELLGRRKDGTAVPLEAAVSEAPADGDGVSAFFLRDVAKRKQAQRRLAAHYAATCVLVEAATTAEALPRLVAAVCENLGWEVGEFWEVDPGTGRLRRLAAYHADEAAVAEFAAEGAQVAYAPGCGTPGRAWQRGELCWHALFADAVEDPRSVAADRAGLHSGLGLPVRVGSEVVGVLALFAAEPVAPDEHLVRLLTALGTQLGQFFERKRAEEELREARERYELAMCGSGDGLWDWDVRTGAAYFSPRWKEMLGYAEHEIADAYDEWESRVHREDRERALATVRAYLDDPGAGACVLEHRLRHKDGSYRWILARSVALRDAAGRPYRMAGSHTDITPRKEMEQRLRDEEALYHSLVETLPLNMFRKDRDGRYTFGNRRFLEALGRALDELRGKTDFDLYPRELAEKYRADDLRVMGTGELFEATEDHLRPDGERMSVQVIKTPVYDANDRVVGTQAIFWDVTDKKRAEEALHQAREAAEAASRAKSEFLANMSHEIRTPMNGILGMTELALDTDLSPEQRDYLGMVKSSAEALLTVINDILDFSKIEAGKLDPDPHEFGLRDCVGDALRTLALRAHAKGLELACDVAPDVPDALVGDSARLRQVLLNLAGNALKFTEKGEVVVGVSLMEAPDRCAGGEVALHVAVRDTGIGIPRDKLEAVFRPFEQADGSTTRRYGGTGLGLTISQRLVQMMGGRIWAESEVGRGSTFHFTACLGVIPGRPARSRSPAHLRGLPVLIVDDSATNRRILEASVRGWGMEPASVDSGEAGLARLRDAARRRRPFALLLLDRMMPGLDGEEVVRRVKADPALARCAVIILSSAGPADDGPGRAARPRVRYLVKPVKQADLLDAILTLLPPAGCAGQDSDPVGRQTGSESCPAKEAGAGGPARRPLRVLLAEDNAVNQRLATRLLERAGHAVVVVGNGAQAVAAAEREPFDVVLMDVQMPEMDGLEATAAIRARERDGGGHQPIIAMTAHAMKGDRERCLEAGMDGYVSKPIQPAELWAEVESVLAAVSSPGSPPVREVIQAV
jgi:PAS domain S-box-containing protein